MYQVSFFFEALGLCNDPGRGAWRFFFLVSRRLTRRDEVTTYTLEFGDVFGLLRMVLFNIWSTISGTSVMICNSDSIK
jgi:hypothetical protein